MSIMKPFFVYSFELCFLAIITLHRMMKTSSIAISNSLTGCPLPGTAIISIIIKTTVSPIPWFTPSLDDRYNPE